MSEEQTIVQPSRVDELRKAIFTLKLAASAGPARPRCRNAADTENPPGKAKAVRVIHPAAAQAAPPARAEYLLKAAGVARQVAGAGGPSPDA